MKPLTLFTALTFLLGASANADTVIEFKYLNNMTQLLTNGDMARINARGTDEYMLVNFKTDTIYSVTPGKKQIFNLSDSMPSISSLLSPQLRVKLKPLGTGPTIAGYPTNRYGLSANGDDCGTVFASREALKGTAVENVYGSIKTMADHHRQSLGGFAALVPSCQLAQMELGAKLQKIGAPMRILDKTGRVESEITKIMKNARVEPQYYTYPTKYRSVSVTEKLESILKQSLQTESTPQSTDDRNRGGQQRSQIPPQAMEQQRYYQDGMRYR